MREKVLKLLQRFPVTDLALAVTYKNDRRLSFLRRFVRSKPIHSYAALRRACQMIYDVQPPLLPAPREKWIQVEAQIRKWAQPHDLDSNLRTARLLRDLISERQFLAHHHDEQSVLISPGRSIGIGIKFYIVEKENVVFQFVQPRATAIFDESVVTTLMSMVHYGDYPLDKPVMIA